MFTPLKVFTPASGAREAHMIARPDASLTLDAQLAQVVSDVALLRRAGFCPVFMRCFLSDPANQIEAARRALCSAGCPVSFIGQAPLDGAKVAVWVWAREGVSVVMEPDGFGRVDLGDGTTALFQAGAAVAGADSLTATRSLLTDLAERLPSLADNCLRTWFFVRDVDLNYSGLVKGRNEVFGSCGLTPQTHFIASTGINGVNADPRALVTMDSLSYVGLPEGAVNYLKAPSHLNPTSEYGVAFERAVAVDFTDRRHVYVSGTASINNRGEIVHPGDVLGQARRMIDNVDALLAEGGCAIADVAHMIVYLRDPADYGAVSRLFAERFHDIPTAIVLAPVCRPGWLIEMECMAVRCL